MIGFLLIVCATFLPGVDCIDRRQLAITPQPAKNFDLHSWSHGEWYTLTRYLPCSFSGSGEFSNIITKGVLDGKAVTQHLTWRDGICSTGSVQLTALKGGVGLFTQRDPYGGMVSGPQIVVVYNPKKGYQISWGCTKNNVDGNCADPWVLVKTRKPFPARFVWECVVRDLKRLWDMSLNEMIIVSHKNPC